jgi:hypothetical protein
MIIIGCSCWIEGNETSCADCRSVSKVCYLSACEIEIASYAAKH